MAGRLLRISMEPAPGYLPFVESHLASLRSDAHRLTGDGSIAEEVSSGALTDVALRWYWFELLRLVLGRSDPAGAFLDVALTRRCARRLGEPDESRELDVGPVIQVQPAQPTGWSTFSWYSEPDTVFPMDPLPAPSGAGARTPAATSAAVRVATLAAAPAPASTPSALLEAVIAWLHAYKTYIRYRRIAATTVAVLVLMVLIQLRSYGAPI
jgi:hypothetical protein